jgi:hypothetical protein
MKKAIALCIFVAFALGAYLSVQTERVHVRRVIGNPGDRIEIHGSVVFINGMPATL